MTVLDFQRIGLDDDPPALVDYRWAWDEQRRVHAEVVAGTRAGTVLLLEHESVYTAGRRTLAHERPFDGTPVIDVDRGGKITWHGPGQLVGYPIIRLPAGVYVVDYVRRLEEALIRAVQGYGLPARRVTGRSGVWLPAVRRVPDANWSRSASGMRTAQPCGFALNVRPIRPPSDASSLAASQIPGQLAGRGVSRPPTVAEPPGMWCRTWTICSADSSRSTLTDHGLRRGRRVRLPG